MDAEIPADILETAKHVAGAFYGVPVEDEAAFIAKYLLAERERCAKIAEERVAYYREIGDAPHAVKSAEMIAELIRS